MNKVRSILAIAFLGISLSSSFAQEQNPNGSYQTAKGGEVVVTHGLSERLLSENSSSPGAGTRLAMELCFSNTKFWTANPTQSGQEFLPDSKDVYHFLLPTQRQIRYGHYGCRLYPKIHYGSASRHRQEVRSHPMPSFADILSDRDIDTLIEFFNNQ